jgi:hypothetical protein
MIQSVIAYIAVAAAAGWVAWSYFPRLAKASTPKKPAAKDGGCGSSDCGCGD